MHTQIMRAEKKCHNEGCNFDIALKGHAISPKKHKRIRIPY